MVLRLFSRRLLTALILALLVVPALTATASASSRYNYRNSERAASAWWQQIDAPVDGIVGYHNGELYVYETGRGTADAFVWISDAYCPEGVPPWSGGGHGDPEDPCTYDFRFGEGFGLAFTMTKKLDAATLAGRLTIYGGHGGDPVGRPAVDMAWNGTGSLITSSETYRYRSECCMDSFTFKGKFRSAGLSGHIGPMGFDPDRSGGSMSQTTTSGRGHSK